jgi:hypothetical protein
MAALEALVEIPVVMILELASKPQSSPARLTPPLNDT